MTVANIAIWWLQCSCELRFQNFGFLTNKQKTTKTTVEEVVFGLNLFVSDDEFFWSESVLKRLENRSLISSKRSEAGKKAVRQSGTRMLLRTTKTAWQ